MQLTLFASQPISLDKSITGWKEQKLLEGGEPLIALSSFNQRHLLTEPAYFQKGIPGAIEEIYVRESVARKLAAIAEDLPEEYTLLVWDAWRPLAVQQALFDGYSQMVRVQCPQLPEPEVRLRTERYVSLPSPSSLCPSPHYTGGAVDLTLADAQGDALWMGTEFDGFDATAGTCFFEKRRAQGGALNEAEELALRHRRLLYHMMYTQGFTNYAEEWWHFDYGNQFWGIQTGEAAFYGPIEP